MNVEISVNRDNRRQIGMTARQESEAFEGNPPLTMALRPIEINICRDLSAAEPVWRALQTNGALCSPYQRFELLAAWQTNAGTAAGVEPLLVIGRGLDGTPMFLWPLGRTARWPLQFVHFLGGKHVSFNIGLWQRDVAETVTAPELTAVLSHVAARERIDLLTLLRQPVAWDGIANPFTLLAHQPGTDQCNKLIIDRPAEDLLKTTLSNSMRSRLRTKERHLQKLPGYRYMIANTTEEINRLLDQFFALKTVHMAAQGLPDVFAEPGIPEFIREACRPGSGGEPPAIEIHALVCDDELLAMFASACDHERFSLIFNTYTLGENGR